ncbi:MAG: ATP-binding cassette domain-containing protein [Lachnospiraceae bacterium]
MLTIDKLSILRREQLRDILKDFSLQLGPGDKAVLIGEEGNGKSTLLKLIHDPDSGQRAHAEWSGSVSPGGRTGYLPQELGARRLSEPARLLFERSPGFAALTPRQRHALAAELGLDRGDVRPEAATLRAAFPAAEGQITAGRPAAEEPELYLLDEPSNDLDLESLEWLEDFILSRREPVLFVSHDETLIERTANVVVHLELLRRKTLPRATVARLPYRDYVEARSRGLARQEQAARKEREEFDKRLERYRQIRQKVESAQNKVSRQDPHGGRLLRRRCTPCSPWAAVSTRSASPLHRPAGNGGSHLPLLPGEASIPNGKRVLELSLPSLDAGGRVLSRDIELRVTGPGAHRHRGTPTAPARPRCCAA